jgi:hypothetical protein
VQQWHPFFSLSCALIYASSIQPAKAACIPLELLPNDKERKRENVEKNHFDTKFLIVVCSSQFEPKRGHRQMLEHFYCLSTVSGFEELDGPSIIIIKFLNDDFDISGCELNNNALGHKKININFYCIATHRRIISCELHSTLSGCVVIRNCVETIKMHTYPNRLSLPSQLSIDSFFLSNEVYNNRKPIDSSQLRVHRHCRCLDFSVTICYN